MSAWLIVSSIVAQAWAGMAAWCAANSQPFLAGVLTVGTLIWISIAVVEFRDKERAS